MVAVTHQGLLGKPLLAVLIHKRELYITENNHWRKLNHNVLDSTTKGKSCDHTMQIITHFSKIYQYLCLAQKKCYNVPGPKSPELLVYIVLLSFWSKGCLSPSPIFIDSNLTYALTLAVGDTRSQMNILYWLETPWPCEISAKSGCDALM